MTAPVHSLNCATDDYTLFLAKLKDKVLKGEGRESCLKAMSRKAVWSRLASEQLLELAGLAQMIGEVELGLEILEKTHELYPEFSAAWREHIEVLHLLGRSKECVSLRVRARENGTSDLPVPASEISVSEPKSDDVDDHCLDPFVQNRKKETQISLYLDLFRGREDCFARQWADKKNRKQGYVPVRRSIGKEDVEQHLRGIKTYGIYLLDADSNVRVGVLDADINSGIRGKSLSMADKSSLKRERDYMCRRIEELGREKFGAKPLREFSGGKGYHFWFFFACSVQAALVRRVLQGLVSEVSGDLEFFNLEVFPKQDRLRGKGLGNLVKLPLGLHRLSGKPSYFVSRNKGNSWKDLDMLNYIQLIEPEKLDSALQSGAAAKVSVHPREEQWAGKYPELHALGIKCPLLGGVFVRARQGRELSMREEKIVLQTVGFMRRANTLVHAILCRAADYNSHLVDYKLSRLRGKPLGCKKIHQLLNSSRDFCEFESPDSYIHPLLHCPEHLAREDASLEGERVETLKQALNGLQKSIDTVQVFLNKNS